MIHWLIELMKASDMELGFFRLLEYPLFRALMAAATALLLSLIFGFRMIVFLYRNGFRDTSGDFASLPVSGKRGTPTGGGSIFLLSFFLSLLVWGDAASPFLWVLSGGTLLMGLVGFVDDFLKVRFKSSLFGLSQKMKTLLQFVLVIIPFALFFISDLNPLPAETKTQFFIPFYKFALFDGGSWFYFPFILFAFFAIGNAVNITDGKDGLAGGTIVASFAVFLALAFVEGQADSARFLIFPYLPGTTEIAIFISALIGGVLGFLWFNTYPAEVFMGDTGSLALGAALAMVAFLLKQEMLVPIVGGIFVIHAFTSLVQDKLGYRLGRRLFHRAPYHHDLTHKGIAEPKVVVRLWIIAVILALIGFLSLKIR
jgi:phospho-N-acetylmuramoyl-pentapeptide-transferase